MVWMKVTNDELELPVAVADSAVELAKILGVNPNSIASIYSKYQSGIAKSCRYRKVVIDDD